MENQKTPGHLVKLSSEDVSAKTFPPSKLLCNWRQCTMGPNATPARAKRLCRFCCRVGYCCVYCLEQDIYGHITHECAQNVQKAKIVKNNTG